MRPPVVVFENTRVYPVSLYNYDELFLREGLFYNTEREVLAFVFHQWEDLQIKDIVFLPEAPEAYFEDDLRFVEAKIAQIPKFGGVVAKCNVVEKTWYGMASGGLYMQADGRHLYLEPGGSSYVYTRPPATIFELIEPVGVLV